MVGTRDAPNQAIPFDSELTLGEAVQHPFKTVQLMLSADARGERYEAVFEFLQEGHEEHANIVHMTFDSTGRPIGELERLGHVSVLNAVGHAATASQHYALLRTQGGAMGLMVAPLGRLEASVHFATLSYDQTQMDIGAIGDELIAAWLVPGSKRLRLARLGGSPPRR